MPNFPLNKNSTKGKIELQQIHVHSCIYLFVQALKKTGAAVIGPNKQLLVVKNIKKLGPSPYKPIIPSLS